MLKQQQVNVLPQQHCHIHMNTIYGSDDIYEMAASDQAALMSCHDCESVVLYIWGTKEKKMKVLS